MRTEDIEKLALAYTEKEYYKVDNKDELNGEPLAVFKAYCQALSIFQALQDNSDKKYTNEDMWEAFKKGLNSSLSPIPSQIIYDEYIKSLNKKG